MSDFKAELIKRIEKDGPIPVSEFMGDAVAHYYQNHIPFGIGGDFVTAPEISQMFGELVGLWCVDIWIKLGKPEKIHLIECGPGKGTMMADMLRATSALSPFRDALSIHLIENSMSLMVEQKQALSPFEITWHENIDQIALDAPFILIANEFLDAMPVEQYVAKDGKWHKRMVELDNGQLEFTISEDAAEIPHYGQNGDIIEVSHARDEFAGKVAERLAAYKGAALFIDYGHERSSIGDTLQAVKAHNYVDVLEKAGEADITAHVDFESIAQEAVEKGCKFHGPVGQGAFLEALGIYQRAEKLAANASAQQQMDLKTGLVRLTGAKEMGALFKVMAMTADDEITPSGF